MERFDIGNQKEVLWDMARAERSHGVRLQMHKLTRKGSVLESCEPWEGVHVGYAKIVFDGEKYRFYYRGGGKNENGHFGLECVAYSYDGKTFEKPNLGIYEYNGSKENNIVMMSDEPNNNYIDNFSIMLDENPACEPDAKYKGERRSSKGQDPPWCKGRHQVSIIRCQKAMPLRSCVPCFVSFSCGYLLYPYSGFE